MTRLIAGLRSDHDSMGRLYDLRVRQLRVPMLLIALSAATCVIAGLQLRRVSRPAPNTTACPGCGYDLRAIKDRCPECGRPISSA